jgi:competence protein ComEC
VGAGVLVEWVAVGMIAGQLGAALDGSAMWGVLGVAGVAVGLSVAARRAVPVVIASVLAAGLGWALVLRATAVPDDRGDVAHLPLPLRAHVVGRVASVPIVDERRTIVVLEVASVSGHAPSHGRVRLRIRGPIQLTRGDVIGVETTLRRPRNFENPGRFDLVGTLARRGVHVTGSVWEAEAIVRLGVSPIAPWTSAIDAWRTRVRAVLATLGDSEAAGVLLALVLGDERGIATELRTAFTRAGVVHVLSVSGLHVGIVTAAAAAVVAWVLGRSRRVLLRFDRRKIATTAGLLAAAVYGALTGFEVATVRSLVMAGVVVAAVLLERSVAPRRALALAAFGVAVLEPGSPAEISYQLSFASVAALIVGAGPGAEDARRWRRWVRRAVGAALACWLGTAPLTAFHFHQVSLVSVVANPLVVPLFEAASLLPALLGAAVAPLAPDAARVAFEVAAVPVRAALVLVRAIGGWRWAAADVPYPSLAETALLYAVATAVWYRRAPLARGVLAIGLVVLASDAIWWACERTRAATARVTFLDVGQGDAAVLELGGGRVVVVDAGGFSGSDFDTGAAIVEPFLRTRKIATLDALVMSHAHPDHAGGLGHLVRRFAPAEVWWSGSGGIGSAWDDLVAALRDTGTPVRHLRAGSPIPDFPEIDVLHPPAVWTNRSLNEGSLVLRARVGAATVLLTGDAEGEAERAMREAGAERLVASVLKVPHHGSRTSSSWPFVAAVDPAIAIVSVGADNRFGHPAPEVEARFIQRAVAVYRTDRCGAIEADGAGNALVVSTMRPACREPHATTTPPPP